MKNKKTLKNSITYYLLILILFCTSMLSIYIVPVWANSSINLDTSDVLSDLKSDSSFDLSQYGYDKDGELQLLSFNEYCFSYYDDMSKNYGLYVYVYNPRALKIDVTSLSNKIQIGFDVADELEKQDYNKYSLLFLSKATKGEYANLFYKFKVLDDAGGTSKTLYQYAKDNEKVYKERRYAVSGIELKTTEYKDVSTLDEFVVDSPNAVDYVVGKTYKFSGYCEGYGEDPKSEGNLKLEVANLTTLSLDLHHTYYRTKTSNKGEHYQNQIDSVYFSVPQEVIDKYGKLQRIKAEWYEYKTKDVVVMSNEKYYNLLAPHIGESNPDIGDVGLYQDAGVSSSPTIISALWAAYENTFAKSLGKNVLVIVPLEYPEYLKELYLLFPTKNFENINAYDPYSDDNSGVVKGSDLLQYIYDYNKTYNAGTLPIKNGKISADLFLDDIDESRKSSGFKKGQNVFEFDADIPYEELFTYKPGDHSFAENSRMYGFWNALFGTYGKIEEDIEAFSPICPISSSDFSVIDNYETDSKNLLINYNNVADIKKYVSEAENKNEQTFLFRFGVTDYYAANISIYDGENVPFISYTYDGFIFDQAYRARQTVFLDFDIISLTFKSDLNELTVIPVVSNPIDMAADITPWVKINKSIMGKLILIIILCVVGLIVLCIVNVYVPVFKWIGFAIKYTFVGLWWVIKSPYLLVKWIVGLFKKE